MREREKKGGRVGERKKEKERKKNEQEANLVVRSLSTTTYFSLG